ncbi:TetR/AcrR family transcriptional regulator [Neorhizobium sp. NPDC001467]|uniref:TetR/AcrR family transcriptional regulator n=1 Tax=Neorhizobium sp. NPDC001467 TaxID=3390595 RepID=UPI003CFCA97F
MAVSRSESMKENRARLIASARRAFAEKGYAAASMDELTSAAGLTRGALYSGFGDKRGLLAAVVEEIDGEMAVKAGAVGATSPDLWDGLMRQAAAYIEMALNPEVQRIVLLDGPAVLGDPSSWPSQNSCLKETMIAVRQLAEEGRLKPVDVEVAGRLLCGAAFDAALWVAASDDPPAALPKAVEAFRALAEGLLAQ